ncbi:MAG: hypothetical protein HDT26_04540 [Subdoligranulum sp.]|nr:hypothetical protein [Subdoligranulum sp.]
MNEHIRLGDVFALVGGGTPSTSKKEYWGNGVPWFSSADIDIDGKISCRRVVTPLGIQNSTTNIVPAQTVVVVTRVGLGKVAKLPCNMCFSQDIQALQPVTQTPPYNELFLMHQLSHIMSHVKFQGRGTTISGITKKQLNDVILFLPPLVEQIRIVARIEELFSQLDASASELKTAKERLKVYRQAVLKEAFDSALQDNPPMMSIEGLLTTERKGMSTGPFGTMIKKHDHQTTGVPMLGIENIGAGKFIDGNKIFVTLEKARELKSFALLSGDIIISRSGTVGELCAVPKRMEGALLSTNLMRVSLNSDIIHSDYFIYLFQSKGVVLDQVKELCKGSTRIFLNQAILKQITFPVPDISKQKEIIKIIESRMSVCDSIEKTLDTAQQRIQILRQSILKKAFEGEL